MGASNTLKMLARGDIEASRGIESVRFAADKFVLITDDNDALYCPGVADEPSEGLVQSMRNGWLSGSIVICVNRGQKGGVPVPVVVAGRSRIKAARRVNDERKAKKLALIEPEAVFVSAEEAADLMYLENNKQERSPTFDARRWIHFKKIFVRDGLTELSEKTGRKGASDEEVAGLESEARASYSAKTNCKTSAFKRWELIMSAHPEVLAMCDAREPGINLAAVKDIVESTDYDQQPEAARRVRELAMVKKGEREIAAPPIAALALSTGNEVAFSQHAETIPAPAPEAKKTGKRSEAQDRKRALGIATVKPRSVEEIRALAAALERTGNEAFDFVVAALRYAANDPSVESGEAFVQLAEAAKGQGWKA